MRHRRLRRPARRGADPARRAATPRVPRLRLGRHRPAHRVGRGVRREEGRQAHQPDRPPERRRSGRAPGHRPHPLGDPRPPQRRQRASAHRLQRPAGADPQRDHRELPPRSRTGCWPPAIGSPPRPIPRCWRTSSSRSTTATWWRRCDGRCRSVRGAYAIGVMHTRPSRSDRRGAHERAADRGARARRGFPGQRRAGHPGAHQERRHPAGGRHRRRDRRRGAHRAAWTAPRSSATSRASAGTSRPPRRAASRTSP